MKLLSFIYGIKNSSLFKASGVYTISSIINASIPFILLPILTNKLSPADYGIVAMFQLVTNLVYPFIGLNLEGAIARKYYDNDGKKFSSYIGTCFFLSGISFLIISIIFFFKIDYINKITLIPINWLKYILISVVCQFIIAVLLVIFQIKIEPFKYGFLQIAQSILNMGLTILFVVIINNSWEGRLEAQIISICFFAIISFFLLIYKGYITFEINKSDIVDALKFGIPLIPHAIGGMLFTTIDRFFLTKMIGLEQTGNYTVAYQLGSVVGIITVAFNNAYVPWLYKNLNKDNLDVKIKIVRFTYLYFIILSVCALALLLLFPTLVNSFVDNKFSNINLFSTFIVLGFVFQGMYFMVTNYISYIKKTYIQALLTFSVGIIKLPITYFFILWFGPVGASISFCLTFFIFFISTWYLSSRVYKMPWNIYKIN